MSETLSYRRILLFWLPLAGTWLMMAIEGPYLAAIIARLPDPTVNLAAFGGGLSIADRRYRVKGKTKAKITPKVEKG